MISGKKFKNDGNQNFGASRFFLLILIQFWHFWVVCMTFCAVFGPRQAVARMPTFLRYRLHTLFIRKKKLFYFLFIFINKNAFCYCYMIACIGLFCLIWYPFILLNYHTWYSRCFHPTRSYQYSYSKWNFPMSPFVRLSVGWYVGWSVGWMIYMSLFYKRETHVTFWQWMLEVCDTVNIIIHNNHCIPIWLLQYIYIYDLYIKCYFVKYYMKYVKFVNILYSV